MWRVAPALPLVSLIVALFTFAPQLALPRPAGCGVGTHPACTSGSSSLFALLAVVALPVSLFAVGFFGAERWWYARVASGDVPLPRELWRVSWGYFWRFVRLGLLVAVLSMPVVLPILLAGRHSSGARAIALAAYVFILDIALTFVTPAMALSTESAWQALKTGIVALDRFWPRDALYAVVPPMALTIVTRVAPDVFGSRAVTAFAGVVAQLLTMFFAGAVTLLYVREIDPEVTARLHDRRSAVRPALSATGPGE
jgi:hypothetical protein